MISARNEGNNSKNKKLIANKVKLNNNIQFPPNQESGYSDKENLNFSKDELNKKKSFSNSRGTAYNQTNSNLREFGKEITNSKPNNVSNPHQEISTFGFYKNNLADKGILKNYQSIYIKMAPAGKSVAAVDMEKIKKKISISNFPVSNNQNLANVNKSKEFNTTQLNQNFIANGNSNNPSNINYSSINTGNNNIKKGNFIILNNSKNKTETNINNKDMNANNSKNFRANLNFSNDYYTSNNTNNMSHIPGRFIANGKNMGFIAAASKNVNKNENLEKNKQINEFKFNSNNVFKPNASKYDNEKNKKSKSIGIKIKEKEIQEEIFTESFYKNLKKETTDFIYSRDKKNESTNLIKNFSKDHFKDLKNHQININEVLTNKLSHRDLTNHFLPINGKSNLNDNNKNKNMENSLNGNSKNKLRNNINITNNSSYDDQKFSFHNNLKNSRIKDSDDKEKLPSAGSKKIINRQNLEKSLKNEENQTLKESVINNNVKNFIDKRNLNNINNYNKSINIKIHPNSNNSAVNLILDKKVLHKKSSESLITNEKKSFANLNKIDKLKNLELKDLDSLEVKTQGSSNNKESNYMKDIQIQPNNNYIRTKEHILINNFPEPNTQSNSTNSQGRDYCDEDKENMKPISISTYLNNLKNIEENKLNKNIVNNYNSNLNKENLNTAVSSVGTNNANMNFFMEEEEKKELNPKLSNIQYNPPKNNNSDIKKNINNPKIKDSLEKTNKLNKYGSEAEGEVEKEKIEKNPEKIQKDKEEFNYKNNPQIPYEYLEDIHTSLSIEEAAIPSLFGYMRQHTDINEQMRAILVDWIIEVHSKFNLKEETLFLCVNIIDKYLKSEIIPRSKLQLLGVSSIMIACKQEEIYSPSIKDFVFITDNAYTKQEIFEMEYHILKILEFNTVMPSSLRFYELISLDFGFDAKQFYFGLYLLELYLIDYRMTKYLPSVIACTAAYIVMKFFKLPNYTKIYSSWNKNTNSSSLIKDCAREICFLVDNINGSSLKATKKKFSQEKYESVSLINFI